MRAIVPNQFLNLQDFEELNKGHLALVHAHRDLVDSQAGCALASNVNETLQVPDLLEKYIESTYRASRAEEDSRQFQLILNQAGDLSQVDSQLRQDLLDLSAKQSTSSRRLEQAKSVQEASEKRLADADVSLIYHCVLSSFSFTQ